MTEKITIQKKSYSDGWSRDEEFVAKCGYTTVSSEVGFFDVLAQLLAVKFELEVEIEVLQSTYEAY